MVWDELDLNTIDLLRSPPKTEHFCPEECELFLPCVTDTILTVSSCDLQAVVVVWHSVFCKVTSLSVLLISYGLSPAVVFARKIKHLHLKASPFSLLFQHAAFSLCASLAFF